MSTTPKPVRRGVQKVFTLSTHAIELLEAMAPHAKAYGLFLGELLAAEAARREARTLAQAQREQEREALPTRETWDLTGNRTD
jgi:hypothetical protein